MRRIEEWLGDLGLGEYASRFAENDIDFEILAELTDQDLEKIGVTSLGHRRKLLKSISELNVSAAEPVSALKPPTSLPDRRTATAQPEPLPAGEVTGERRYLTVLFCDLVDSTGIAARLDAEEWRDLVGAYFEAASAGVTEMGGTVAKKLGDGLMALFGYPTAHENDAERAARAALAIQRSIAELNRNNAAIGKPELAARVGIETGPVVVDAAGEIFGDAPNVASRVQALAQPGAIMITGQVQRQTAGLFVAEERGAHELKGLKEPVTLFRLVRASGGGRRSSQRMPTPLVGREEEIAMLMRRWERARQADGQFMLIVGEPGLGKSRLIEEFHARLRDTPHTWVEWSCSQLLQNTPLHPIAEWGRQRFGGAEAPAEGCLAELESSLAQVKLDPAELVPLLAPLLDMPLPPECAAKLAPEELRRRQLAALTNWLLAGAKVQPVVLAVEDLHWADPTTLDVLKGIAERGALAPLSVLATARPEFKPGWGSRSHHGTISLVPLDRSQVRHMVGEIAARHALPQEVIDGVTDRTGGVPLFVEEVTRLLLERGSQDGAHVIPPTLQQSLMARLDRLGPAREIAQVGSVIGRGFSYGLLSTLTGMEDAPLQAALEQLADADILLVQGLPPDSDYRFKHALIQDAAYENLLKSRRQVLHRRVAEILRDRFPDTAAAEPEVLAHHFTQTSLTDAAIDWWGKAGDQALRRSAFQEAISHLSRAIAIADKAGEGGSAATPASASTNQRLKLQTRLGRALMYSRGFAAEESRAALIRARELAAASDNPTERFTIYYGQLMGSLVRGELWLAREIAETFLREAESAALPTECGVGRGMVGNMCLYLGDFVAAQANFVESLSIYDPERDREARFRFSGDSGATRRAYLAVTKWLLGDVEAARALIEEAVALAIETDHVPTLVVTYAGKATFEMLRGNAAAAWGTAEIVLKLSQENALTNFAHLGALVSAWASARLDGRDTRVTELRQALTVKIGQGFKIELPFHQGLLAEIEAEADADEALTRIDEALALAGETGERWSDAFLHRVRAKILLKRDPANTTPAEEAFLTAITIAQQQKARSLELRAALDLARLYHSTGRSADAHALLASALDGFSPTPEFPEIEEAQALLGALAETDEVKNASASRQRRLKLQTSLGKALSWSRGLGAKEAKAAFARARELAATIDNPTERFTVYHGLWTGNLVRGELMLAREIAETFLREAEREAGATECGVGRRMVGLTCLFQGDLGEAQANLVEALRLYDPQRDREAMFRLSLHSGATTKAYLATTKWLLGEVGPARALNEEAVAHAVETDHVTSMVQTYLWKANFESVRGDAVAVRRDAEIIVKLSRENALPDYAALGAMLSAWVSTRLEGLGTEATEFRQALAAYTGHESKIFVPFLQCLLAEIEAQRDAQVGLTRIDEALALARETGEHWSDAFLHRARGKFLLECDPADTELAEEAFLMAVAVAQQQKARSLELRAALDLARLYSSIGRSADAHTLLAPAIEGFSPSAEFPEIAEAHALFDALAETDEVKNAAASRKRRLKLQTDLGKALAFSRGFGAEETKAAFIRARELAAAIDNPTERLNIYHGLWIGNLPRGDLGLAREIAETFLREAERGGGTTECGVGRHMVGVTCLWEGNFIEAQANFVEALNTYRLERDSEARFQYGLDTGTISRIFLATTKWLLGEVRLARGFIEGAVAHAVGTGHVPTLVNSYIWKAHFEIVRGDAEACRRNAENVIKLSEENALPLYVIRGVLISAWASARLEGRGSGETAFRQALAAYIGQGNRIYVPFYEGLLAETEGQDDAAGALTRIDEALALADETGEHWTDAYLHRVRGEILLKRDPANTAPAEEAFLTAIAIAQQQKARSFELRAALDLARLYNSTDRSSDAHALLGPALEGFSPTPEFPEIAEAHALLADLVRSDAVQSAIALRQRRIQLQTSLGQALLWSKGFAATETMAAFQRARELFAGSADAPERFSTYFGQWSVSALRGELGLAREIAETFLRETEIGMSLPGAAVAHRILGLTCLYGGDLASAQSHLGESLKIYDPEHDSELKFRFGTDVGAISAINLAVTNWLLGDLAHVRPLVDAALARAIRSEHAPTLAQTFSFKSLLDRFRRDAASALPDLESRLELSRTHGLSLFLTFGAIALGWAHARLGQRDTGMEEMDRGLTAYAEMENRLFSPILQGQFAEIEGERLPDRALARVDDAISLARQTGEHWTDAELHRIRGAILLNHDPAHTAAAEEAFLAAIAIAQHQKARCFELRAALGLARLYNSTSRSADAHALLASALEGFLPTSEFPEIEEAETLLKKLPE